MDGSIHDAALSGNSSSLSLFQDATVLPADAEGNTPLHLAALYGKLDEVKQLVKLSPRSVKELNKQQSSPLHLAVDQGHREVAEELLKADSGVCFCLDKNGLSPVHIAVRKDRVPVLRAMLEAKPLAALKPTARNENVLHMCAKLNRREALELLVKYNEEQDHFINFRDDCDNTALHIATSYRNIEIIKFLVGHAKVDVDARNLDGRTALQVLLHSQCKVGDDDIEEIFQGKMKKTWKKWLQRWGQKMVEKEVLLMAVVGWVAQAIFQAIPSSPTTEDSNWCTFIFFTIPSIVGSLAVVTMALLLMSGFLHQRQHHMWVLPLTGITLLPLFSMYGYLLYIRQMRNWKWIAAVVAFLLWVVVIPKELAPRLTRTMLPDNSIVVQIGNG